MKMKFWTMQTGYAAALIVAAAMGSITAFASAGYSQTVPGKPAPAKAAERPKLTPTKPRAAAPTKAVPASKPAAKTGIVLTSAAMIERVTVNAKGVQKTVLKTPAQAVVVPGDKVIFTISYVNLGREPATGFRATNPMPSAVLFSSVREDWAEVSVDGAQTWGKLETLIVAVAATETAPASTRPATTQDVTHVRWVFVQPIAPGGKGSVSYMGIVK